MGDRRSARLGIGGGGLEREVDYAEIFGTVSSCSSIPVLDLPAPAIAYAGAGGDAAAAAEAESAGIDYALVFGRGGGDGDDDGEGFGAFYEDLVAEAKGGEEEEEEEDEGGSSNRRNLKGTCLDQDATEVSPSPNLVCDSPSNPKKNELNIERAQEGRKKLSLFASIDTKGNFQKTTEKEEKKIKEMAPSSKLPPEATPKMGMKPKFESEGCFQKPKGNYQFQNCGSAYKYKKAHQKSVPKSPSGSTDAAAASAALKEAMEQAEARLRSAREMRQSKGNLFKSSAKLSSNDVVYKEKKENNAKCGGKSFSKKLIHAAAAKKTEFREEPTLAFNDEEKETGIEIKLFQSAYNSVEMSGKRGVGEEISQLVSDANDAEDVFKTSEKEGKMKESKAKSKNGEEEEETESNYRRTREMVGVKEKSELESLSKKSKVITKFNDGTEKSRKTEKITNEYESCGKIYSFNESSEWSLGAKKYTTAVMNTSRKEDIDMIINDAKAVCIPEKGKNSPEPCPHVVYLEQNKNNIEDSFDLSIMQEKTESKSGASKGTFKFNTISVPPAADESVKTKAVTREKGKNNEEGGVPKELILREAGEKTKAVQETFHHEENENIKKMACLSYFAENTAYDVKEIDHQLEHEEPEKFERTQYAHNKGIIGGKEIPQLQSCTKKSQVISESANERKDAKSPSKYHRGKNAYSFNETCEWSSDAKKYTNTSMNSKMEEEMKELFDTFPKFSMRVKDEITIELSPEVDVHGRSKNNIELELDSKMNWSETSKDSEETCKPDDYYVKKGEKKSLASKKDNECTKRVEDLNTVPVPPVLDESMKMKARTNSRGEDTNNEENRVLKESFLCEAEKKMGAAQETSHYGEKEKMKEPGNLSYFAGKDRSKVKEADQNLELTEHKKLERSQYTHNQDKSENEERPEVAEETIEDAENKNKVGAAKEDSQLDYADKWTTVTRLLRQCSEKNQKATFGKEKTMEMMREDEEHERKDVQKEDVSGKGGVEEKNIDEDKLLQRKLEEEKEREIERQKDNLAVERVVYEAHERAGAKARERATKITVDKVIAESRQRALAEAREKAAKAFSEKASEEAKMRAAVARATAEALERAAQKAALEVKQRTERSMNSSRDQRMKENEARDRFQAYNTEIIRRSTKPDDSSKDAESRNVNQRHSGSNNHGSEDAPALRFKARIERHQRTAERAAKALAEKNMRDMLAQREQEERNRFADSLDAEVRRWATGKEGNLRALLSTLQYILGPDSGWQPISLTDLVTANALKKSYRKAALCVHPDKLQQKGASVPQKYKCEKVFDLLKDAWNRFNSEQR